MSNEKTRCIILPDPPGKVDTLIARHVPPFDTSESNIGMFAALVF